MVLPEKITLLVGDFSLPSRYLVKTLQEIQEDTDVMFVVCVTGMYTGWNVLSPWSAETRKANMVALLTQEVGVELDRIDVHNIYSYDEQNIIDEVACALHDTVDNLSAQVGERIGLDTLDVSMVPYGTLGCIGSSRLRSPLWTDEHAFLSSEGEFMTLRLVDYALNLVNQEKPLPDDLIHDLSDVAQQTLTRYVSSPDINDILARHASYMEYLRSDTVKKNHYHIQYGGYVLLEKMSGKWCEDQWTLPTLSSREENSRGNNSYQIISKYLDCSHVGVKMTTPRRDHFSRVLPMVDREVVRLIQVSIRDASDKSPGSRLLPIHDEDNYRWFSMSEVKRMAQSGLLFSNCGVIIPCK